MDPRARIEFKELLKELALREKPFVVSSHILSELAQMCTDIGIIDAGKIVLSGNMGEILKKVNDSNPIRIQVVENVWEAVKFLRTEPEVQTITVEGNDIVVGFHGGKDAEAMLLAKTCGPQYWNLRILERAVTLRASSCRSRIMIWKRW